MLQGDIIQLDQTVDVRFRFELHVFNEIKQQAHL